MARWGDLLEVEESEGQESFRRSEMLLLVDFGGLETSRLEIEIDGRG